MMHLKIIDRQGVTTYISRVDEVEVEKGVGISYRKGDEGEFFITNPFEAYLINDRGETIDVLVRPSW